MLIFVQIEETMQALHDVVQAGYVRYIGMSSCWAWQFHVMQSMPRSLQLLTFIEVLDTESDFNMPRLCNCEQTYPVHKLPEFLQLALP